MSNYEILVWIVIDVAILVCSMSIGFIVAWFIARHKGKTDQAVVEETILAISGFMGLIAMPVLMAAMIIFLKDARALGVRVLFPAFIINTIILLLIALFQRPRKQREKGEGHDR
jgi:O-antigen/teichoic acid export membrane protein